MQMAWLENPFLLILKLDRQSTALFAFAHGMRVVSAPPPPSPIPPGTGRECSHFVRSTPERHWQATEIVTELKALRGSVSLMPSETRSPAERETLLLALQLLPPPLGETEQVKAGVEPAAVLRADVVAPLNTLTVMTSSVAPW